eukprot:scaffold5611_cov132-Isochrysis_galbana.AAC.14
MQLSVVGISAVAAPAKARGVYCRPSRTRQHSDRAAVPQHRAHAYTRSPILVVRQNCSGRPDSWAAG